MLSIYHGPYARVDIPELGVTVDRGQPVEVPADVVLGDDWTDAADPESMTVAELRAALTAAGVAYPTGAKRADLLHLLTTEDDR